MKSSSSKPTAAFTLLEILVTISIISVLAGLVYSGVAGVIARTTRSKAGNAAYNVKLAMAAYFSDYRRHAVPDNGHVSSSGEYMDAATNDGLMDILLAADTEVGRLKNPRGIPYFTGGPARPFGSGRYISGLALNEDGGGSLWDPFGRLYGVRIDISNRDLVANPEFAPPAAIGGPWGPKWGAKSGGKRHGSPVFKETVLVWSSAKDPDSSSDNATSW